MLYIEYVYVCYVTEKFTYNVCALEASKFQHHTCVSLILALIWLQTSDDEHAYEHDHKSAQKDYFLLLIYYYDVLCFS